MIVWVHRDPSGFETNDLAGIEELEEHLKGIETFEPLEDDQNVHVEITGTWGEIKELLSQPLFKGIWFRVCRVCGCTDSTPCQTPDGPCHWVEPDLCSACVGKEG